MVQRRIRLQRVYYSKYNILIHVKFRIAHLNFIIYNLIDPNTCSQQRLGIWVFGKKVKRQIFLS